MNFKKIKKLPVLLLMLVFAWNVQAQSVLLEDDVDYYDNLPPDHGKNRKHYYHGYARIGSIFGPTDNDESPVNEWGSKELGLGLRYKLKFSNLYSIGYDLYYGYSNYRLEDDNKRTLPSAQHYKKEKIQLHSLGISFYQRFNFGRRGDYIGNFLDMGAYGQWSFSTRYFYKQEINNDQTRKVSMYGPDFVNVLNYGVLARAGYNRYMLYGKYRLSELINTDQGYADLPLFTVGIQIGMHK